jgi:hypothetical protein
MPHRSINDLDIMQTTFLRDHTRPSSRLLRASAETASGDATAFVARNATRSVSLNTGAPLLLGVFGKAEAPQALVRLPSGKTEQVRVGDRLGDAEVRAIDETTLTLVRAGQSQRLRLP